MKGALDERSPIDHPGQCAAHRRVGEKAALIVHEERQLLAEEGSIMRGQTGGCAVHYARLGPVARRQAVDRSAVERLCRGPGVRKVPKVDLVQQGPVPAVGLVAHQRDAIRVRRANPVGP